jgi:UDP-GlcNAc:undecaprenyl-phosphate/decaprenyl-phosphate GlcNAc-1-phosphate transferase
METASALAAAGALALIVSIVMMPLVILVAHRRRWFDIPNERKIHTDPLPRLGGIGLFLGLLISSVAVPLVLPALFPDSWPVGYSLRYVPVFVAFCLIFVLGLVDDFHNLRAELKFSLQIAAAVLVALGGFTISVIRIPGLPELSLGIFGYPITALWIVTISNAINLVDGVDGLAGGITGISALSLGVMCLLQGQVMPALLAFSLLGAVLGFLAFNFPPARIFMGDSGSLLLGFVLAVIPLMDTASSTSIVDMLAPATVLLVPIIDTISAIARRVRARRPIYKPDRDHVHHKLLALGLKETSILLLLYGWCVYAGIAAVVSLFLGRGQAAVLLAAVWTTAIIAYAVLHSMNQKRKSLPAGLESR